MSSDFPRVCLHSATFEDKFLRLDGSGVTSKTASGGGTVNTQTYVASYESFIMEHNSDGSVSFRSVPFNNVYLRLDGANVPKGQNIPSGGGVVNAQFGKASYEKFMIRAEKTDNKFLGVVALESVAFPGRFLRMNGSEGQINAQGVAKSYERWHICVIPHN